MPKPLSRRRVGAGRQRGHHSGRHATDGPRFVLCRQAGAVAHSARPSPPPDCHGPQRAAAVPADQLPWLGEAHHRPRSHQDPLQLRSSLDLMAGPRPSPRLGTQPLPKQFHQPCGGPPRQATRVRPPSTSGCQQRRSMPPLPLPAGDWKSRDNPSFSPDIREPPRPTARLEPGQPRNLWHLNCPAGTSGRTDRSVLAPMRARDHAGPRLSRPTLASGHWSRRDPEIIFIRSFCPAVGSSARLFPS